MITNKDFERDSVIDNTHTSNEDKTEEPKVKGHSEDAMEEEPKVKEQTKDVPKEKKSQPATTTWFSKFISFIQGEQCKDETENKIVKINWNPIHCRTSQRTNRRNC